MSFCETPGSVIRCEVFASNLPLTRGFARSLSRSPLKFDEATLRLAHRKPTGNMLAAYVFHDADPAPASTRSPLT